MRGMQHVRLARPCEAEDGNESNGVGRQVGEWVASTMYLPACQPKTSTTMSEVEGWPEFPRLV